MKNLLNIFILAAFATGFSTTISIAQNSVKNSSESTILLSGKVKCIHPINGTLSLVIVFNKSKEFGTVSKQDGSFSINMSQSDTIVFTTAEHQDYIYVVKENEKFLDHSIEVVMVTDAVWLNTVTILGFQSLEQFKQEILSLDIPQGNTTLALPVVSKYAKQLSTGNGETDLIGPLTYLQNKFNRYNKIRKELIWR